MAQQAAEFARERQVALQAVREACLVCRVVQHKMIKQDGVVVQKGDESPVTVADFAAQALVNLVLQKEFPEDGVVGEEDSQTLRKNAQLRQQVVGYVHQVQKELGREPSAEKDILNAIDHGNYPGSAKGRFWTIDPIDGTKGYIRCQQYAVALGLVVDGVVRLGVLGCPNFPIDGKDWDCATPNWETRAGLLFVGVKGQGAYKIVLDSKVAQEQKISVSQVRNSEEANFVESVEAGHSSHDDSADMAALLGVKKESVRMDSQCKYSALAEGDACIYLRLPVGARTYVEKIWDHAAGIAVIEAAGGRVTDTMGKDLDFSRGRTLTHNVGVIASNGFLHEKVIEASRKVLGEVLTAAEREQLKAQMQEIKVMENKSLL